MKRPVRIFSHAVLVAAGIGLGLILRRTSPSAPPAPAETVAATSVKADSAPAARPDGSGKTRLPEKRGMTTSAEWRIAWEQALLEPRLSDGEPRIPDGFFTDWCEVDPDGAIRGLAEVYSSRSDNLMRNAISKHGAVIAPALVKHFRELKLLSDSDVSFPMAKALNALAKDDPARAGTLTATLPPGIRGNLYRNLFEQLDPTQLDRVYAALPKEVTPEEMQRRNSSYVAAVDFHDQQAGVWTGLATAGDPALRRAFAEEGIRKATRGENWTGFFDAVERLDPSARDEVKEVLQTPVFSYSYPEKARAAIAEETQRRALGDWLAPAEETKHPE